MKLLVLIFTFIAVLSCRPEQAPTEYNITVAPQAGENAEYETLANTPITITYEVEDIEINIDLEVVMSEKPKNGILKDCIKEGSKMTCLYIPNEDFTGIDTIGMKTKDGDFESEEMAYISIKVNPDLSVPGVSPEDIGDEVEEVITKCTDAAANGQLLTQQVVVNFPAAIECSFNEEGQSAADINQYGNGPRENARIRARIEQYQSVNLPSEGTICDIDFNFPEQVMEYDDEIFLTMNNYVLMSSTNYSTQSGSLDYINGLIINPSGLMEYKWMGENGLYNLYYNQDVTPKYCLGVSPLDPLYNDKCEIPATETFGQLKLDIPSTEIIKIGVSSMANQNIPQSQIQFGFITTGDNDDGDCEHSAYSFDVTVTYLE